MYLIHDADSHLVYVGTTTRVLTRLAAHRRREWWPTSPDGQPLPITDCVDVIAFPTPIAARTAEAHAISRWRPPANRDVPASSTTRSNTPYRRGDARALGPRKTWSHILTVEKWTNKTLCD